MDRCRPPNSPARPLVLIVEEHPDTRALCALALQRPCLPDELAAGRRHVLDGKAQAHVER